MDFHREGNNWYYYNAEAIYQVDIRTKAFRQVLEYSLRSPGMGICVHL